MPTKERIAKEKELEAIERELDELLLPKKGSLKDIFDLQSDLKSGCGIYLTNFISFDEDGNPWRHADIGRGGNEQREDDRRDRASRLKIKYPEDWCSRGGAGRIFRKEAKLYEKEITEGKAPLSSSRLPPRKKNGDVTARMSAVKAETPTITAEKLTEGTIRRYFNDFP